MIFKKLRPLIYSPLDLIIGDIRVENVEVNDPEIDMYDYYEVIGIRAGVDYYIFGSNAEGRIIVSLKSTLTDYTESTNIKKPRKTYEAEYTCKK